MSEMVFFAGSRFVQPDHLGKDFKELDGSWREPILGFTSALEPSEAESPSIEEGTRLDRALKTLPMHVHVHKKVQGE